MLGISPGSVSDLPRAIPAADRVLMRRIDELHLEYPFAGSRMLQGLLLAEGYATGRLHVATLMKRMAIEALDAKPNTSNPAPGHKIFPDLLRKLPVTRPNQVWTIDITDIPMARGFVDLTAGVDWFSRKVLAFFNGRRPHQSLGRKTPDQAYFNTLQPIPAAAKPGPKSA